MRESETEVTFELPTAATGMADLLSRLDKESASLGVGSYGVAMPTLEEVFLRLQTGDSSTSDQALLITTFAPLPPMDTHETTWWHKVCILS